MSLLHNLTDELKAAMRAKDVLKLEALRAIKSAVLLAKTSGVGDAELSEENEIKLLQKLVKQRKDSAGIYREQNREDLAAPEDAQAEVIAQFLPEQLSEEAIEKIVDDIITKT
ncbi:MAG: GatB/YqeY domain-containing protein, partial [Bacteroidetes bacterium]|nr:GatB/YqeY domain-containing protein [Bacteroidota bacterium]